MSDARPDLDALIVKWRASAEAFRQANPSTIGTQTWVAAYRRCAEELEAAVGAGVAAGAARPPTTDLSTFQLADRIVRDVRDIDENGQSEGLDASDIVELHLADFAASVLAGAASRPRPQEGVEVLAALKDIVDDLEARWDMDDPRTNPGIKHNVERAKAAIAKAETSAASPPPQEPD
jgi:hypothetical protein